MKYHSVTDVLQQVGKFVDDSGIKEETENGIKAALQRTRQRVEQLEQQLISLGAQLEALENKA